MFHITNDKVLGESFLWIEPCQNCGGPENGHSNNREGTAHEANEEGILKGLRFGCIQPCDRRNCAGVGSGAGRTHWYEPGTPCAFRSGYREPCSKRCPPEMVP